MEENKIETALAQAGDIMKTKLREDVDNPEAEQIDPVYNFESEKDLNKIDSPNSKENSISETHSEKETEIPLSKKPESSNNIVNLTIFAGKNAEDSILTIDDEPKELNSPIEFVIDNEKTKTINIKVEKEHYKTYQSTLVLNSSENTKTVTVELEPKQYTLDIQNIFGADSIDVYAGAGKEFNHYTKQLSFEYGTRLEILASKKGYKDYRVVIDSISKNTNLNIETMEKITFNLSVKTKETPDAIIKVNGTPQTDFPLVFDLNSTIDIEIKKEHYETYKKKFNIKEDTDLDIKLELEKHDVSVTTIPPTALVKINNVPSRRELVEYGKTVNIVVSEEGYVTKEKSFKIFKDSFENFELEKKPLTLTIDYGNLDNVDISLNSEPKEKNVKQLTLLYGEEYNLVFNKEGYKPLTKNIALTEDDTISLEEWKKPTVSVNISNKQNIVKPVLITINSKPVSNNVPVEIDYNSEAVIKVECEGYQPINETRTIKDNWVGNYELVDIHSKKVKLTVNCELEGAEIKLDGILTDNKFVEPNNNVIVTIEHPGYLKFTDTVEVTENTIKTYTEKDFIKNKFQLGIEVIPIGSKVLLNGEEKQTGAYDYLSIVHVEISAPGYLSKTQDIEITENTYKIINLEDDPEFVSNNDLENNNSENISLNKIIEMIKFRNSYTYLRISSVFKIYGYVEKAVAEFYKYFGWYVNSRYDYKLWKMMHAYFTNKKDNESTEETDSNLPNVNEIETENIIEK